MDTESHQLPASEVSPLNQTSIDVDWVPLGKLTAYGVYEHELDIMEQGSSESRYFNIAVALGSIGLSFLVSLFTTEIKSPKVYLLFLSIALIGIISSIILLFQCNIWRKNTSNVIKTIKNRRTPTGERKPLATPSNELE